MNSRPKSNRRRFGKSSLLVRPREQFRYALILVGGGVIGQCAILLVLLRFVSVYMASWIERYNIDAQAGEVVARQVTVFLIVVLFTAIGFAFLAAAMGLKLSHRLYGPLVPMNRMIEDLCQGKYSARLELRNNDEFAEIKDALNRLAESLEARHPNETHGS